MGCFVRGGKNGMGCYVRGDKNGMGCYVRGGKLMRDVVKEFGSRSDRCLTQVYAPS